MGKKELVMNDLFSRTSSSAVLMVGKPEQIKAILASEIIYPAFSFNEHDPVVQLAQRAITSIGLKPRLFHSGGGSDANVFNGLEVPTINLAVGYEHIHTTQERIKAEDIVKVAELVVSIVKESVKG